ncbi:TonB-dependent receptor [Microbulbifer thermotolerans]|uniref:TonB-dependent receptor n=1 Tax=Microbulbifer thermotolerans TaxID=252514 RepID=UPI0022498BCF|nr:TonB-dependent receptor [Microbulbifer thermotolerans]MCX2796265.1 TonB-dependent receptor [Microbulbifer thermotolerans]
MNLRHRATLSLAILLLLCEGAIAACPTSGVTLPAGNLSRALISLGRQCQVSVLVQASSAASYALPKQQLNTNDGDIEPILRQLLQDLPFTYELLGPSAVAVVPRKPEPEEQGALSQGHTEEISVTGRMLTGSHLRHPQLDSYAPIDILAQPELEITGAQTVSELLKFLPAVSGNSTSTSVTNGGDGTATVTLRGLPASNTLVLINGRRIVNNGFGGEAADLNTIPLSAVDRIEILKDGASAVYGSDAIAGVVNIILRRDFEGLSVNSYYGEAQRGDQQTGSHHLTWGKNGERGHLMLSLAHYRQDALMSRDREISATADNRSRGGTDNRSSASPSGYIALSDDIVLTANADGSYRPWTQEDRYDYSEYTTALVPSERQSAYLEGNLDLGDNSQLFIELMGIRTSAETTLAPTPVFTRFDNGDLTISADNIYNPFGQEITDVRKRVLELGPRVQNNDTETWRLNLGLTGMLNSWQWELTAAQHYTHASESLSSLIDPLALSLGLKGPDICNSESDCIPINLLGPSGSIDAEQLDYIRAESLVDGITRMTSLTYIANGTLGTSGAGDILAAFGMEIRREAIDFRSNDAMGLSYIGGVTAGSAQGHRIISETFGEISLPLVADRFWLDGALRYSNYSDFGSTANPKVALRFRALPSLMLRASYATGFKAPTLIDMNQSGYQSQEYLFDPCTGRDAITLPGCRGQADGARIQYLTEYGGNPDLQPETSDNRSLGIVWTPAKLKGFSATLDLFEIRQNDVIDTSPQYLIDQNASYALFSDRVQRDEQGEIITILATRLNIGAREVRGADLAMRYEHNSDMLGQLRWSFNASHIQRYLNQAAPGEATEDLVGTFVDAASGGAGSLPKWKANTGIYWKKGPWEGGYTVHFVSALEESFTLDNTRITRKIDSWTTHDLQVAYALPGGLRIAVGIDNLFDREPPFAATAFNDNFDGRTYDLSGRYWYTTLAYSL